MQVLMWGSLTLPMKQNQGTVMKQFNDRPPSLFSQEKPQVFNLTYNEFQSTILKPIILLAALLFPRDMSANYENTL